MACKCLSKKYLSKVGDSANQFKIEKLCIVKTFIAPLVNIHCVTGEILHVSS